MDARTLSWLAALLLLGSAALRAHALMQRGETDTLLREQAAYQYLRERIRERYVEPVEERQLFYGAMNGMASSLDRHSRFLPPEEFEQLRISTSGLLEGVGIEWDSEHAGGLVILTPLLNSPAWHGGILPGDRVLKINGESVEKLSLDSAGRLLRGVAGTTVRLTVLHRGENNPVDLDIKRAVFEIPSLSAAEILTPGEAPVGSRKIGYVAIVQFQEKTAADLGARLRELEAQGMEALILDLRQNPGGLLDAAEDVADLFLRDGEIVSVLTREAASGQGTASVTYAREEGTHPDYPLAILIDGQSASAAEIVSGALRDRGRAILVGEQTYGKFSVQNTLRVPMGNWGDSALKLTIARYKTPSSPCIDGKGFVPDIHVPFSAEQLKAFFASRRERHVRDNDPRKANGGAPRSNARPFADTQLQKAAAHLVEKLSAR